VTAEYIWLKRFIMNWFQQNQHSQLLIKVLLFDSLVWIIETNKHYYFTEQETLKLFIVLFILFSIYTLLFYFIHFLYNMSTIIIMKLQQLLCKVMIHFNSYLQKLQSIIHSHTKITDKRRSVICLWNYID